MKKPLLLRRKHFRLMINQNGREESSCGYPQFRCRLRRYLYLIPEKIHFCEHIFHVFSSLEQFLPITVEYLRVWSVKTFYIMG